MTLAGRRKNVKLDLPIPEEYKDALDGLGVRRVRVSCSFVFGPDFAGAVW